VKWAVYSFDETSVKPVSSSSAARAEGSCIEKTALTKAPSSGPMCSTIACSIALNSGWMRPGVLTTTRPPGVSTRYSSARAPVRSSMNMRPIWQSATS
jgi:hypothetical protein